MGDLEAVIASPATMENGFKTVLSQKGSKYADDTSTSLATEDESYQTEEHIAANFSDGFYVGEIHEEIDDSTYSVSCMSLKVISTADCNKRKTSYRYWPSKQDIFHTNTSCILHLRPVISIAIPPSTKRLYIFGCSNAELLEIIANSVSDVILFFYVILECTFFKVYQFVWFK